MTPRKPSARSKATTPGAARGAGDPVRQQPHSTENWFSRNISVANVLTVGSVGVAVVAGWVTMQNRVTLTDERYQMLSGRVQRLDEQIVNLPYRVTVVEQQMGTVNTRIDRVSENVIAALDGVRKDIAQMTTRLEVLTQRLETLAPPKRADADKAQHKVP